MHFSFLQGLGLAGTRIGVMATLGKFQALPGHSIGRLPR